MPRKKKTEEEKKEVSENAEVDKANKKVEKQVEKEAEKSKKEKLAELVKKAKALEGVVKEGKEESLKQQVKPEEEKANTLVPIEDYLKASIHLGTRVITPDMRKYVYRRRADGLAVFNTALLDEKLREGADFLAKYAPEDVIVVCKREAGWKALEKFAEVTGMRIFSKKYPAGILTNTTLETFTETDLVFICDPWLDKNAFNDAKKIKIPVLSICDTNNYTQGIDKIIPGNNKNSRSLGIILYLVAKIYVEKRKLDKTVPPISEWIDNWDTIVPPK